jgi:hypothetical protein
MFRQGKAASFSITDKLMDKALRVLFLSATLAFVGCGGGSGLETPENPDPLPQQGPTQLDSSSGGGGPGVAKPKTLTPPRN